MTTSSIVFGNPELFLNIFNKISPDHCVSSRAVCKAWMQLLVDKTLWKPVMTDLKWAHECEQMEKDPSFLGYIEEVRAFLEQNRDDMKFIVELIEDDGQLSMSLHTDRWTLKEFKEKGLLERSRILWKALHQDATPILVNLLGRLVSKSSEFFSESYEKTEDLSTFNQEAILNQFNQEEKFSVIAITLIQKHKVSCNPVDVIYTLLPATHIGPRAKDLLVYFIKLGKDLSGLDQKPFAFGPASAIVLVLCRELVAKGRLTRQDLINCKLLREQNN